VLDTAYPFNYQYPIPSIVKLGIEMNIEILGSLYTLDLSFSLGDVIMTVLTVLVFRITYQMAVISKNTESAEKQRTLGRTYYLIHSILMSMEDDEILDWNDVNRFNEEYPLMLQLYDTDTMTAIHCFRKTTYEYSQIKLDELKNDEVPDGCGEAKERCIRMTKHFRDKIPLMKEISNEK